MHMQTRTQTLRLFDGVLWCLSAGLVVEGANSRRIPCMTVVWWDNAFVCVLFLMLLLLIAA